MKTVSELEGDIKWWQDELRARRAKVEEAERTLGERERDLADAQRAEDQRRP